MTEATRWARSELSILTGRLIGRKGERGEGVRVEEEVDSKERKREREGGGGEGGLHRREERLNLGLRGRRAGGRKDNVRGWLWFAI